jgi:predicted PurR-regulated permease PerM
MMPRMSNPPPDDSARWFRRALAAMAGIGLALAIWQLQQLVLVIFASALVGLMLSDFAAFLQRVLRLPFALAIAAAVLIPLFALVVIFGLFGTLMTEQFIILSERLPAAVATVEGWIRATPVGADIMAQVSGYAPKVSQVVDIAQATLANVGSAVTGLAVVLVAALYLAAQPRLYVDGLIDMLAPESRPRVREAVGVIRASLTAWLKGQAIGMAFVAVGTSIGLWIVGLPSPLAIGLVAGLCEFVPYLGVVLVAIPTVILGFGQGVESGIFTIIALAVVQQLQGNVVMPIAQKTFGDLPPVLTIFSLIAAGTLLGPLGVILAVPLTVVFMALLKVRLAWLGRSSPLTGG